MITYKKAGVDIDAGNALVELIKKSAPWIGGFSGLPKFRQLVAAIGRAPVQATLRAASATAFIAPSLGSR